MRITQKDLELKVSLLNEITGSPINQWTRKDGKITANIGHYYVSQAYGGVNLVRNVNQGGGVSEPLSFSHMPKRELYQMLCAFIAATIILKFRILPSNSNHSSQGIERDVQRSKGGS